MTIRNGVEASEFSNPGSWVFDLKRMVSLHNVLVSRNIKARYEDTLLGLVWTMIGPLLIAAVLVFLLQDLMGGSIRRFSSYLYIGVLVYSCFRGALSQATRSVVGNRLLAQRPGFPPEVLPVVPVTTNFLDFLFSFPILAVVLFIGGSGADISLLAMLYLLACQYLTCIGLACIASAWHVLFRDVGHVIDLLLTLGFFLTPIFYDISQVPEKYQSVLWLNPIVPLLEGYRTVLIEGVWPPFDIVLTTGLTGIALAIIGIQVFRSVVPGHIEEI